MNQKNIYCQKLKKSAKGLEKPPYPGELGQRIYENICEQAWANWQQQQIKLINEYRIALSDPQARKLLEDAMEDYLFGQ